MPSQHQYESRTSSRDTHAATNSQTAGHILPQYSRHVVLRIPQSKKIKAMLFRPVCARAAERWFTQLGLLHQFEVAIPGSRGENRKQQLNGSKEQRRIRCRCGQQAEGRRATHGLEKGRSTSFPGGGVFQIDVSMLS